MSSNLGDGNQHMTVPAALPPPFINEPKGYALSGKIMLSAIIILFAVVVIMVCFHIYARWYILRARRRNVRRARRRTHLVFYIDPNDSPTVVSTATRGLDEAIIKSLPIFDYEKLKLKLCEKNGEVLECAVCLSEFEDDEQGRMLPKCNNCFHVECIDMWFHSHDTCPLCRAPVEQADLTVEKSVGDDDSDPYLVELTDLAQIKLPRRCKSFSFTNSDESGPSRSPGHGFKSPTNRVLSLKRFLSRDRKSLESRSEHDLELGRLDPPSPTIQ